MELGGLRHRRPRVFLLSTTHGAENPALAAALRGDSNLPGAAGRRDAVAAGPATRRRRATRRLRRPASTAISKSSGGRAIWSTWRATPNGQPSQAFRTLFLRETLRRGLLMPSMVVSYAHDDATIDATIERVGEALAVYKRALEDGVERYLPGRPVAAGHAPPQLTRGTLQHVYPTS